MSKVEWGNFNNEGNLSATIDKRWWKRNKDEMSDGITSIVRFLREHQGARETQIINSICLYGNASLMGINGFTRTKIQSTRAKVRDRISFNVVQAGIDTVTAKISKSKPKPLFLTNKGDYRVQKKAKKLNQFVDGIFYENDAYNLGLKCFKDGAVIGDGLIHVYRERNRVKFERVLASEILVDELEAFYGDPRQMHRVKSVDRSVLMDLFPERKSVIQGTNEVDPDSVGIYENISDVVEVRESWHLPSGPEANDGKHVISVENGWLLVEEYNKPFFPFARFQWDSRICGYWSQGGAEQVQNLQNEINKRMWVAQRTWHLAGSFKVLMENGSKIVKEHINNDIGAIVMYTGTKPEYVNPPGLPDGFWGQLLDLKNMAFEQLGVSQLSATSQKPAGLNSGKALREYNDIETERFMAVGQSYENFYLELAKLAISTMRDIFSEEKKYEVKVPGKKFVETIDWKDIDLEDDEYTMKVYPISSLPSDPAGRLQTIQEYIQAGFLTPRTGRRLLDFPDLEQVESLANAEEDYLNEILEKMVDEGIYTPPEPEDDLELALELTMEYIAQGKLNNLEEGRLQLLRNFKAQVDQLITAAMPPAPPAPSITPQAAPMPQPVSDLVPNVPGMEMVA